MKLIRKANRSHGGLLPAVAIFFVAVIAVSISVHAEELPEAAEAETLYAMQDDLPRMAASEAGRTGSWVSDTRGWWYRYSDGTYPRGRWALLGGKWYHFDASGYMQSGWFRENGRWYFLHASGEMATGWLKIGNVWHFFYQSGEMATGWIRSGGFWYYLRSSGYMATGWQKVGGTWYYLESTGAMKCGWLKDGASWYYLNSSGAMLASTSAVIDNKRYMFDASGRMTSESEIHLSEAQIWNYLYDWLGNSYGTAGLMGNLFAESSLQSNNLENLFNIEFGVTDEEYTLQVDDGSRDFIDSAGYGFAQWTFYTRKQELLAFAKSKGTSIADPYMQLEFIRLEVERNTTLHDTLRNASSVREASDAVLVIYERPADMSDSTKERRAGYGQGFYDRHAQ